MCIIWGLIGLALVWRLRRYAARPLVKAMDRPTSGDGSGGIYGL